MTCELCGARLAQSLDGMSMHMQRIHNVHAAVPKPTRTKQDNVTKWETANASFFENLTGHPLNCDCMNCWPLRATQLPKVRVVKEKPLIDSAAKARLDAFAKKLV